MPPTAPVWHEKWRDDATPKLSAFAKQQTVDVGLETPKGSQPHRPTTSQAHSAHLFAGTSSRYRNSQTTSHTKERYAPQTGSPSWWAVATKVVCRCDLRHM